MFSKPANWLTVGASAAEFNLPSVDGQVRLSDFTGRHNLVLYVMSSFSCSRCWRGALALASLHRQLEAHDTVTLVVGCDDRLLPATHLAAELSLPLQILADIGGVICRRYGLFGLGHGLIQSATILIDRNGVIRYFHLGRLSNEIFVGRPLMQAISNLNAHSPTRPRLDWTFPGNCDSNCMNPAAVT